MTINPLQSQINEATLTAVVQRALNQQAVTLLDWQVAPAHTGYHHELTGGVYRVGGTAATQDGTAEWTVILKIVSTPDSPAGMDDPHYSRREIVAYQSGLLAELPGQLAAPACYQVEEVADGRFWLWLEDVRDEVGEPWPLAQYGVVARHLGQFNGGYLQSGILPNQPWLARQWLRAWLADYAHVPALIADEASWRHPLVGEGLPPAARERLGRLWQERERLFTALERLPQTVCHQDAYRPNLFARRQGGRPQTVVIDWDKMGIAAVGEEIGGMVAATMIWFRVDAAEAARFGEVAFAGYVEGLREAGWQGDERLARLGYTASSALRWGIPGLFWLRGIVDEGYREKWGQWWQRPVAEMIPQWLRVTHYLLDLADEAFALAA
jgi:hypothetical protein